MTKTIVPIPVASDTYKVTITAANGTTTLTIVDFIYCPSATAEKAAIVWTASNKELYDALAADSFTISTFACVAG